MPDPTKPLKISDRKEYERRQQAYNDSLFAYMHLNTFDNFRGSPIEVNSAAWEAEQMFLEDKIKKGYINKGDEKVYHDVTKLKGDYKNFLSKNRNLNYKGILPDTENFYFIGPDGDYRNRTHLGHLIYEYKRPVQPVEFVKDPPYNKIPTKTPTITPIQQSIDDELKTSFIEPAITYPKDIQRFTAGNYLESQGKSSGYVNYGEGEGRKELYENGGIRNINNNDIGFLFNESFGIQ
jgi:hypothetical protein